MISTILWLLFFVYLVSVILYLVFQNRQPETTLAWLFAFIAFPVIGVIVYFFFGRDHKSFISEAKMAEGALSPNVVAELRTRGESKQEIADQMIAERPQSYVRNLVSIGRNSLTGVLTANNDVRILQDTDHFYPQLLEDLRAARQHIHMLYFIWSNDPFTQEVKQVLLDKVKEGVEVRALYDASSTSALGKEYIEEMTAGGVQFLPYLAYNRLRTIHLANYRSHRKITIIDGKVGFLGGMNLDREQMPGTLWPRWRDTQIRFVGDAVTMLQAIFLANWSHTTGETIDNMVYFPQHPGDVEKFTPMQIVASGPDADWAAIRQVYFYMIVSAEKTCYIQSPFFIPDATILEAMKSAARAGVDVRMICTPRGAKYQMPYRAALTYFKDVASAGVKVYTYNGGYYHAKTISIDSSICTIGSCNMDIRSYSLDYEINAVIYDEVKAKELEAQFMEDLKESTPFSLEEYDKLPVWRRWADSFWRLASPVM